MGFVSNLRDKADEKIDNVMRITLSNTMKNYAERWRELSGAETNDGINWELACIDIEAQLCDPRNLKLIKGGKHRDEFLAKLNSD